MTHYLDTNSSRVLAELYRNFYGFNVIQAGTNRLNILPEQWNVDDGGTPVPAPDSYGTWYTVQDFGTPTPEFDFWRNVMVEDSRQIYAQAVGNGAGIYHTNIQKSLLDHQAALSTWENAGFPSNAIPHYVQSRWDKVMGGTGNGAPSYIYNKDLVGMIYYNVNDVVDFGKVSIIALRAENYMTTEESALVEDAVRKTDSLTGFIQPDPFGWFEDKIYQYNGLILDFDHANPDNWGLKQRWGNMHDVDMVTWETELLLTRV